MLAAAMRDIVRTLVAADSACTLPPLKTKRGAQWLPFSPAPKNRGLDQPIGVLLAFAPEPEVFTRITPDWSVKYMFCPVVAAVMGVAVIE
jgi:hypothetical protein